jgi:hypothetical protein
MVNFRRISARRRIGTMKFLGLKIFISMLEVIAFLLITPCLIVIGWALFSDNHLFSWQSLAQGAVALAVVGGVLLAGLVVGALASLLNLLLAIERNTADIVANTRRESISIPEPPKTSWIKQVFTPVRPSMPTEPTSEQAPIPTQPRNA